MRTPPHTHTHVAVLHLHYLPAFAQSTPDYNHHTPLPDIQPPSAGSLKRLMFMIHTSTQITAITYRSRQMYIYTHTVLPQTPTLQSERLTARP